MDWKYINHQQKLTLPQPAKDSCNLIFYVKKTNSVYLGFYDGEMFYAYKAMTSSFAWTMKLVGKFSPYDVVSYIVVSDIDNKDFKDIGGTLEDNFLYLVKIKTGNAYFLSIVNNETIKDEDFNIDAASFFRIPQFPEHITKNKNVMGKYKWELVDCSNGFYTYNFFKKHWFFGWRHYGNHVVETPTLKDGYEIANKILKTYYEENK